MNPFAAFGLIAVSAFLWLALSALANEPRIAIKSPGIAAGAPADWYVLVTLDPKPENRAVVIEAHGEPGEYRRSDVELAGARSWKVRQFFYRGLSEGCYTFSASVKDGIEDDAATLARAETQRLAVIGHSGYPCPEPGF